MSKPKDFANDLEAISATVASDVGTIMKIIREKQSTTAKEQNNTPKTLDAQDSSLVTNQPNDERTARPTHPTRPVSTPRARSRLSLAERAEVVLENVTTRLPRDTNELLTEAALRQRLKKEAPDTRQEIINEALQEWLHRRGYS